MGIKKKKETREERRDKKGKKKGSHKGGKGKDGQCRPAPDYLL